MTKTSISGAKKAMSFGFFSSAGRSGWKNVSQGLGQIIVALLVIAMPFLTAAVVYGVLRKGTGLLTRALGIFALPWLFVGSAWSCYLVGGMFSMIIGWLITGDSVNGFHAMTGFFDSIAPYVQHSWLFSDILMPVLQYWSDRFTGHPVTVENVFLLAGSISITGPLMLIGFISAVKSWLVKR